MTGGGRRVRPARDCLFGLCKKAGFLVGDIRPRESSVLCSSSSLWTKGVDGDGGVAKLGMLPRVIAKLGRGCTTER